MNLRKKELKVPKTPTTQKPEHPGSSKAADEGTTENSDMETEEVFTSGSAKVSQTSKRKKTQPSKDDAAEEKSTKSTSQDSRTKAYRQKAKRIKHAILETMESSAKKIPKELSYDIISKIEDLSDIIHKLICQNKYLQGKIDERNDQSVKTYTQITAYTPTTTPSVSRISSTKTD